MLWKKGTFFTTPLLQSTLLRRRRGAEAHRAVPPSPGMATYTDKLFKLRNGRWEDILSDEVNREVASRFAGRSVACVDRTVSRQGSADRGISAPYPPPVPLQWSAGGPLPLPIPSPAWAKGAPRLPVDCQG